MSEINSIANGSFVLGQTSATNFVAGPGIKIDEPSAGTVRIGNDETVLWEGTRTSAVTLSESMQNFDYVRLYFNLGANDRPNPVINCRYSPVMTVSWAQGVANAFQTFAYISANPTAIKIVHTKQVNFGSFTSTAAGTGTGTVDETNAVNSIQKVVGINRISGSNA